MFDQIGYDRPPLFGIASVLVLLIVVEAGEPQPGTEFLAGQTGKCLKVGLRFENGE
eukprot:GAFH01002490.1.p5 GENE.GAFH01002490.1~~GAFH01002490.1.p5  ORF type:complete len:56 (-),score=4.99 GAFH01002490.1:116-283(-)